MLPSGDFLRLAGEAKVWLVLAFSSTPPVLICACMKAFSLVSGRIGETYTFPFPPFPFTSRMGDLSNASGSKLMRDLLGVF